MTPERCKELLPVMQAFAEGRKITLNGTQLDYHDFTSPGKYEIKPVPHLRPWTAEEAIGKVVRDVDKPKDVFLITSVHAATVYAGGVCLWNGAKTVSQLRYTQLDGSPCGVEVTE